jgi:hypothetical protein
VGDRDQAEDVRLGPGPDVVELGLLDVASAPGGTRAEPITGDRRGPRPIARRGPIAADAVYGPGEVKEVPSPAPPLFLAVAADDTWAAQRSIEVFSAYRKGKGLAELHIFQMGEHGFVNKGGGADHFMDRLQEWLAANKLLSKAETGVATPP